MKASSYYGSKSLKAVDLPPKGLTAKILDVMEEDFDEERGTRTKLVLQLENVDKKYVLNASNMEILREAVGDETDDWIGCVIHLGTCNVMFNGAKVKGITIKEVILPQATPEEKGK